MKTKLSPKKESKIKTFFKACFIVAFVFCLLVLIFSSSANKNENKQALQTQEQVSKKNSRCVDVPVSVQNTIHESFKEHYKILEITKIKAVKSNAFEKLYFIAIEISDNSEFRAVFSKTGELESSGIFTSVNDVALEASLFPYGPDTKANITMYDDGAIEAKNCISN